MRIEARRLTEEVLFLAPTVTHNTTYGSQDESWSAAFVDSSGAAIYYPAEVLNARGSRMIYEGDIEQIDDIVVNLRYNTSVTERMRLRWQGRLYGLIAPPVHQKSDWSTKISARRIPE